ncbi:MAG: hypothetical protein IJU89_02680 [Alphaproteobacteria bacterium]|nr:hypothetical protein [Alphaproteobacteria bacterium]
MNLKKNFLISVCCGICGIAFADDAQNQTQSDLAQKIQITKNACSGISEQMNDMKKLAGINTAITGVGTVAGTTGLIAGAGANYLGSLDESNYDYSEKVLNQAKTISLGATAATDTVGTIIAAKNHIDDDLQTHIDKCVAAINDMHNERLRARGEENSNPSELAQAEVIERMCYDWKVIDLSKIDKRATGAAISGGTGAALAVAGAITTAGIDEETDYKDKEKQHKASNTLAGGASVASGVATIFNAAQISAIKKAVAIADKCEEALK